MKSAVLPIDAGIIAFFNNDIIEGIVLIVIGALLHGIYQYIRFKLHERKIYKFVKNSDVNFRSTEAIVAHTNLESARIQAVASTSKKLRRNTKEKESWCLNSSD